MPWIQKMEKKKTSSQRNETDMRELRQKAYQNSSWRKMRDTYLHEHPLCEDCLAKGKVTAATDVHHIRSPFRKGEVNWMMLLDYNNLMSLCKPCHAERHNRENGNKTVQQTLEELDNLLNNADNMKKDE